MARGSCLVGGSAVSPEFGGISLCCSCVRALHGVAGGPEFYVLPLSPSRSCGPSHPESNAPRSISSPNMPMRGPVSMVPTDPEGPSSKRVRAGETAAGAAGLREAARLAEDDSGDDIGATAVGAPGSEQE